MKNILIAYAVLLGVAVIGGLIFVYSGIYNVAADKDVGSVKHWLLSTTMENSVEARLDDIDVPNLDDEKLIESGIVHYDEMCVSCHGAPGVEPGEIARGLNPEPPELTEIEEDEDPAELFWVTKHGIEMTGMPAWGVTHDNDSIWGMVALMKRLPDMSGEEYEALLERASRRGHHNDGGHGHDGAHHGGDDDAH